MPNFNNIVPPGYNILSDDEFFFNRIFLMLFGGLANERISVNKYMVDKAVDFIMDKYGLKDQPEKVRYYVYVGKKKGELFYLARNHGKQTAAGYTLILREGLLLHINKNMLNILFNDNIAVSEIIELEKELEEFTKKKKAGKKKNFFMIVKDYDGFDLQKYKVRHPDPDIGLHYNDDFQEFDKSVKSFLNDKSRTGLILMHGKTGTGKTTYIRHLISHINRRFIFLPLFMAEALTSPDLLPFLSRQKNSILIIEDSEKLIADRETGNGRPAVSTLLNISDGLLSDALGVKLICTFNTNLSKIDKALLRKGRMINRYEFKELSVEKASKIAQIHGLPYDGKNPITIGDLFNIENNNAEIQIKNRIGYTI